MSSFKQKCEEFFGTSDFYEVLKVSPKATDKEIKKAYHRLSLLVHPDRVSDPQKATATEKFKVLGRIHSVLQNADKRRIYDQQGTFDEESDADANWMDYWRSMFKKIELADIERYEKEYVGSETEYRDIKKSYESSRGNMDVMLQLIPFSNCDNEPRIIEIVRGMVDRKEVPEFKRFFHEPPMKRMRRHRKWADEKAFFESIDNEELSKEIENNQRRRGGSFLDMIANIETKYGGSTKRKSITNGESPKPKRQGLRKRK